MTTLRVSGAGLGAYWPAAERVPELEARDGADAGIGRA